MVTHWEFSQKLLHMSCLQSVSSRKKCWKEKKKFRNRFGERLCLPIINEDT